MGLCIPHYTAPSLVHGTGLFARQALAPGAVLWEFDPSCDRRLSLESLPAEERLSRLHYGYINPARPGDVVICGDLARFWNFPHPGELANAEPSGRSLRGESVIVASRPIAAGEELLIHPCSDADYFRKMGLKRQPLHHDLMRNKIS